MELEECRRTYSKMTPKTAVVIPTNRPVHLMGFLQAWEPQFNRDDVRVLVIQDSPAALFPYALPGIPAPVLLPDWVESYDHSDIDERLDAGAWCIPRRSSAVRSFGFWLAAQDPEVDVIITLDDDVSPMDGVDLIAEHRKALDTLRHPRWWPVADIRTRGFPYAPSPSDTQLTMLNHGLWTGVPDLDAVTQLAHPEITHWSPSLAQDSALVPPRMYFTMCSMNVAFRKEVAPFLYMPLLPEGAKSWNDIWCGVVFKRIADSAGWTVSSGTPLVRHERASNPMSNLQRELLGYGIHEHLWEVIDSVDGKDPGVQYSPHAHYIAIAEKIRQTFPLLEDTGDAMICWAQLWTAPQKAPTTTHSNINLRAPMSMPKVFA